MKIFTDYEGLPDHAKGTVVVIGNFDGVHGGHRVLLDTAKTIAGDMHAVSVLTFEPHPRSLFRPDDPSFRITTPDMKAERLRCEAVDTLFSLAFDWGFASRAAENFVQDILIDGMQAQHVVIGYDFKFGQLRKGSAETIRSAGLPVTVVEEVQGYSSTSIRQALRQGDVQKANDVLGWDWEISGLVERGDGRGKDFGYPTANFKLGDIIHPRYGVYAARVNVDGESKWYDAAINIGIRPMFELHDAQIESYIFDFDRDIYGRDLRVKPVKFLRGEAKFDTLEDLIAQMDKDCQLAREILRAS